MGHVGCDQGVPLGDFLLTPICYIEKVTLWLNLLFLMAQSNTNESVVKDNTFATAEIRTKPHGSVSDTCHWSSIPSFQPTTID